MVEEEKKEEEKKEATKVPSKFKKIIDEIEKLNVLELSQLVKALEEKFDISPMPVAASQGGTETQEKKEEEQTVFNVELTEIGDNKIGIIKGIREVIQIGLKEAKDLVDNVPKIIKEGVAKEEAEELKKKFEALGAKITLK